MTTRPVVFVGPSASLDDVASWLPEADIRPPIARGDLYRDRTLRYGFFLVLDGVFVQQQAIPPREIIDVVRDGATVVGAASMGALRAADCWPAGMLGVGSIYRRFRSGVLESDDEVAVTFNPDRPFPSLSLALVNIRHSVRRETGAGTIDTDAARTIVAVAKDTFYADRTWHTILERAGIDPDMAPALGRHDLKRADAVRALRVARALIDRQPALLDAVRPTNTPFVPSEMSRERSHQAPVPASGSSEEAAFLRWLVASGRLPTATNRDSAPTAYHSELSDVLAFIDGGDITITTRYMKDLDVAGELDPCLFRFTAFSDAVEYATERGWRPTATHQFVAAADIAAGHGFPDFGRLTSALASAPKVLRRVEEYRDELALAKRVRETLFTAPQLEGGRGRQLRD